MKSAGSQKQWWKTILYPLLAAIIIFSTTMPGLAMAIGGGETQVNITTKVGLGPDPKIITEQKIKDASTGIEVELKLTDEKWASDVLSKKQLILDGMSADIETSVWNKYKKDIYIKEKDGDIEDSTRETLTLVLPNNPTTEYKISGNQKITINLSPSLIENWPGTVQSAEFIIHATPRISLGGSITNGTTLEDLQKGGKMIEISLLNATWDEAKISQITYFNEFLKSFTDGSGQWDVADKLKNTDPNKVVSYSDDMRTLKLKLPAYSDISHVGKAFFQLNKSSLNPDTTFYIIDKVNINGYVDMVGGEELTDHNIDGTDIKFGISNVGTPSLVVDPIDTTFREDQLKADQNTLKLTLNNAKWDIGTPQKKLVLIDSLSTKDQPEEWEKVKKALITTINESGNWGVSPVDNKSTLTITYPAIESSYSLTKDQVITLKVPHQILESDVNLADAKFTVAAQPKMLISGTATSMTPIDFSKGGKTIILTLVKAEWKGNIATNTTARESLLDAFTWPNAEVGNAVKARGSVKRTNDKTVVITLPSISEKVLNKIQFTPSTSQLEVVPSGAGALVVNPLDAILIESVNTDIPTVSGTIKDNTNEFDIVTGGKVVTLTLKNDAWAKNLNPAAITITGNGKTINLSGATVERKSDTVINLKLPAQTSFGLAEDTAFKIDIPASLLTASINSIPVPSAFTVAAVKADFSGTASKGIDAQEVQKGGKTIVITLKNAEFKPDAKPTFNQIFGTGNVWSSIGVIPDATISKNKMTIKLPALPNYSPTATNQYDVKVPNSIIKDAPGIGEKKAGELSLGAIVSATISGTLTEKNIQKGGSSIRLTLNSPKWDPAITTTKAKKSALLKGFSVTDQTKEWSLAVSSIVDKGTFSISGSTLTILIPATPNYAIVRDQKVNVTIPKSVLVDYKYDIPASMLTVKVPEMYDSTLTSFSNELSNLTNMINTHGLDAIRVKVPEKHIHSITMNTTEINKKKISTIEIETSNKVQSIQATLSPGNGELVKNADGSNVFTFVYDEVYENSTLEIVAKVYGETKPEKVYKKIAKGKKVETEIPKNPLDGSYSLYTILTDKSLLTNILKYYTLDDLKIGISN
ncbi:hypothetical protein [Sporosarcina sp.]|uniref:hypothetical protein n=1 Tax=Sporosarcina sp. TaxID=49982 RepID=UPI002616BB5A|nr:hypothetical protein [Sporosarcina sp.]